MVGPVTATRSAARDRDHPEWNDDAAEIRTIEGEPDWTALIAVADGVGTLPLAGRWARSLVESAQPTWIGADLNPRIEALRAGFGPDEGELVDLVARNAWNLRGSAATLLLAEVQLSRTTVRCDVDVVGDCLFVISRPGDLQSFWITEASAFNDYPETIRTLGTPCTAHHATYVATAPCCVAGMTDGLGKWLLLKYKADGAAAVYDWLCTLGVPTAQSSELPDVGDDATIALVIVSAETRGFARRLCDRVVAFFRSLWSRQS